MNPLTPDGHLHDLALEDALDGAASEEAVSHLADCAVCQARLAAARDVEADLPPLRLPMAAAAPPPAPQPANQPWRWPMVGLLMATAAAAFLVVGPGLLGDAPLGDGIRLRGSSLQLHVHRAEGAGSRPLDDGARITAGDRLGFEIRNRDGGHLMVLGIDAEGEGYLCYPQQGGGRSILVEPSPSPHALPEAIQMDDTPGTERLIAVLCEASFTLADATRAARSGTPAEGCVTSEVRLVKP